MLQAQVAGAPEAIRTRLIVEPPRAVPQSVLPAEDDRRAEAAVAGIPPALLRQFGATIRQTHERARVVVIDVPADRQKALAEALAAIGIPARPPNPEHPMLNESVLLLNVPAFWRAGLRWFGDPSRDRSHRDRHGASRFRRSRRRAVGLQRYGRNRRRGPRYPRRRDRCGRRRGIPRRRTARDARHREGAQRDGRDRGLRARRHVVGEPSGRGA